MTALTSDNLRVKCTVAISRIVDIELKIKANRHGHLIIRGYLNSENMDRIAGMEGSEIKVLELDEGGNEKQAPFFNGIVKETYAFIEGGAAQIIFTAVSGSDILDRKKKSRSFQDISMTYAEVIRKVMSDSGGTVICSIGKERVIEKPLIQYKETDWEVCKRLASHFQSYLFCDCFSVKPHIYFGMPQDGRTVSFSETEYTIHTDSRYYELGGEQSGLSRQSFLYYEVEARENCQIGDTCVFLGQSLTICEKKAKLIAGELCFCYRIGKPEGLSTPTAYNEKFTGLSLEGEMTKAEAETVQIKLDIDETGGKALYPYKWTPATGNMMYCMPKTGTRASLYFGSHDERQGQAASSPRQNGESCAGMSDTGKRTFTTEHGKQMNLFPDVLSFVGSGNNGKSLQMVFYEQSMCFQSHNKVEMIGRESIRLEAPTVSITTPQEINTFRTSRHVMEKDAQIIQKGTKKKNPVTGGGNTDTAFSFNYQFDFMSRQGVLCGWEFEYYSPFDDAPKERKTPDIWAIIGKVALGVIAAVAVAAVVVGVAALTGGAAAAGLSLLVGAQISTGALALGAGAITLAAGAGTVIGKGIKEYSGGEEASVQEYMLNSAIVSVRVGGFCLQAVGLLGTGYSLVNLMQSGFGGGFTFVTPEGVTMTTAIPVTNELIGSMAGFSYGYLMSKMYDKDSPHSERMGRSRGNAPRNNQVQNKQFESVVKEAGLNKDQAEQLHRMIHRQGYSRQEMYEIAMQILDK